MRLTGQHLTGKQNTSVILCVIVTHQKINTHEFSLKYMRPYQLRLGRVKFLESLTSE